MKRYFLYSLIILIFNSCSNSSHEGDISKVKVDITINRLDKDLFNFDNNIEKHIKEISSKYGSFFDLYNQKIISLGEVNNKAYPDYLNRFLTDKTINELVEETKKVFPTLDFLQSDLTNAFKHIKYYFPKTKTLNFYTYTSGFQPNNVITGDGFIGINLDLYLGSNCRFYPLLKYPTYALTNLHKERIIVDCMLGYSAMEFPIDNDKSNTFLDAMIYEGKLLYFAEKMLPTLNDELICGYKKNQLKWCEENESMMWKFIIETKEEKTDKILLFSNNYLTIKKFLGDGPFTPFFSKKSPSRAGKWIGWQIVRCYMENNPKITISSLMHEQDCQKILNKAKYKP